MRLFEPQSLAIAYKLARKVEGIMQGPFRKGPLWSGGVPSKSYYPITKEHVSTVAPVEGRKSVPAGGFCGNATKSLTQDDMEDCKRKGLCFWSGMKYNPGHKCVKSQLYQFMVETSLSNNGVEVERPSEGVD